MPCICYYLVLWPTNAQLFHKLSHSYMLRYYRVILREPVINTFAKWHKYFRCSCQYYQQLLLKYLYNLARYWLQAPLGWNNSVEIFRSVIICEIIVHFLSEQKIKKNYSLLEYSKSFKSTTMCIYGFTFLAENSECFFTELNETKKIQTQCNFEATKTTVLLLIIILFR